MRRVVQVGLDGGLGAAQPARDLRDRQVLLVAIVAGQRGLAATLLHTIWDRPLHDHSDRKPTERAGQTRRRVETARALGSAGAKVTLTGP